MCSVRSSAVSPPTHRIHTGILNYQVNGTTLSMTKKGSPLNAAINPCIRQAMRSRFYPELCVGASISQ